MYSAVSLSKYIVTKCVNEECPISNLQLQKILYYIQLEFLKKGENPIFPDDIEAWQFGPVVPTSYYKFCMFGSMSINIAYEEDMAEFADMCENERKIIDSVIEEKRELDPWELVDDTHEPGKAWDQVYKDGKGNHNVIPQELIRTAG